MKVTVFVCNSLILSIYKFHAEILRSCNPICTTRMKCGNRTEVELCPASRISPATTAEQKHTAERLQICVFFKSCSTGMVMMQGHKLVPRLMEYKSKSDPSSTTSDSLWLAVSIRRTWKWTPFLCRRLKSWSKALGKPCLSPLLHFTPSVHDQKALIRRNVDPSP